MKHTRKRRVTLTESQLQNVLTRVVKRVVNEARRRGRMNEWIGLGGLGDDIEKVYQDEFVTVYIPHTAEGAMKISDGAQWGISREDMFNQYSKYGDMYVIITNDNGRKYIYQPATGDLRDSMGQRTTLDEVLGSPEEVSKLISVLRGRGEKIKESKRRRRMMEGKKSFFPDDFDYLGDFCEGYAVVEKNGKYNWINKNGRLLSSDRWFDQAYDFSGGKARCKLGSRTYYVDKNGKQMNY